MATNTGEREGAREEPWRGEPVVFAPTRAEADDLAGRLQAWRRVTEASALLHHHAEAAMRRAADLHRYEFHILLTIFEAEGARMRLSALADAVVASPSRLSYQVARLCERGLIERLPDRTDRRSTFVRLTPAGLAVLARARAAERAAVETTFVAHLRPGDADVLNRVFGAVTHALRTRPNTPTEER